MKQFRKILVIVLALALVLSLCACSAFESKMAKAAQKMSKADSFRMDMDMDMVMNLAAMGESMAIDAKVQAEADVLTDPVKMAGSVSMDMMGEEVDFLFCVEQKDDTLSLYLSSDDGETWAEELQEKQGQENGHIPGLGQGRDARRAEQAGRYL